MGGAAPRLARVRVRVCACVCVRACDGNGNGNACACMRVRAGKADKKFAEKTWRSELAMVRAERKTQEEKEDVKVDEGKACSDCPGLFDWRQVRNVSMAGWYSEGG